MNLDSIRDRLARLSELGSDLLQTRYKSEVSHQEFVDAGAFREWRPIDGVLHEQILLANLDSVSLSCSVNRAASGIRTDDR